MPRIPVDDGAAGAFPTLRQLRAFDAIVAHSSISQAAQAIHLTQPAISQSVRLLERTLGCSLLRRSPTGTWPTAEGEMLHRRVLRFGARLRALTDDGCAKGWRLSLPQIRALIAIARNSSFGEAARALGVSEPTLHRSAREMEGVLGRKLFRRSPEGIGVTRVGARCAAELNLALREVDQAIEELRRHQGVAESRLLIGALPLVRTQILPRAVNRITRDHPATRVRIVEGAYDVLLSELRMGGIDFLLGALRSPPPFEDVSEEMLFVDEFSVIARAGHPLATCAEVTKDDLARYAWVMSRPGTPMRVSFDSFFGDHKPPICVETSSLVTIRALLMESEKLTLLSRHQIRFEESAGMLITLPVTLPAAERPIGLTVRKDWVPTDLQKEFISRLRETSRDGNVDHEALSDDL